MLWWLSCSDQYNPFDNPGNVNIVILESGSSIYTKETITIFTTELLTIIPTVREHIDSFTVATNTNRFWNDTILHAPVKELQYIFRFSYINPGTKKITITNYRDNGDIVPQTFTVQVVSPLIQNDVHGAENDTVSLYTPSVGDDDVQYNWGFERSIGSPLVVPCTTSDYRWKIGLVGIGKGRLWVSDISGNVSPSIDFAYNFIDTTGPTIIVLNKGAKGDTVATGINTFNFAVQCIDVSGIAGTLINDTLFDDEIVNTDHNVYHKLFSDMSTVDTAIQTIIRSWDNDNNINIDTFYIVYDPEGPTEIIKIRYPQHDPYTTTNKTYTLVAQINNTTDDTIVIALNHNEQSIDIFIDTLVSGEKKELQYTAQLAPDNNVITFYALRKDSLPHIFDRESSTIIYKTGTIEDVTAPYIVSTRVNGKKGRFHYVSRDTAYLELIATDEHMDVVLINGKKRNEVSKNVWVDTLILNGVQQFFSLYLSDTSNNFIIDTVWVQRNNLPEISPPLDLPQSLILGKTWLKYFNVTDVDGDVVSLRHRAAVNSIFPDTNAVTFSKVFLEKWFVRWNGNSVNDSAKGIFKTEIVLSDGKQERVYPWAFTIKNIGEALPYLFSVDLPDGIDSLEDGTIDLSQEVDSILIKCHVKGDIKILNENDTIILHQKNQSIKFAAFNGDFDLTIDPWFGRKDEYILVTVIDTNGVIVVVDTIKLLFNVPFPDSIKEVRTHLKSDTLIELKENTSLVKTWQGLDFTFNLNFYANADFNMSTMPTYYDSVLFSYPAIKFNPDNHSNLLFTNAKWVEDPFTIYFVARLDKDASKDSIHILLSVGTDDYIGFGVVNNKINIAKRIVGRKITDNSDLGNINSNWHIFCFYSENGLKDNEFTIRYSLNGNCPGIMIYKISNPQHFTNYTLLGSWHKHKAEKNWDGDIVEVLSYKNLLTIKERLAVRRYLAAKYKIKVRNKSY